MHIARLNEAFGVTGQLLVEDIKHIADMGYQSIFCHRPDGEGKGDEQNPQPTVEQITQAAEAYGIQVVYLPVVPSQINQAEIDAFSAHYETAPKPILGYCRTGKRAMTLWVISQAAQQTLANFKDISLQAQYNHQIWHDVMNMANHKIAQIQQLNNMQKTTTQ